jgi:peroxiredoxin
MRAATAVPKEVCMRFARTFICSVVVLAAAAVLARAADGPKAVIGQPAPTFTLQDQDGKTVNLADQAGKIVVLEWVNPNCPFVQRHYKAKTFQTMVDEYGGKGVVHLAINTTHNATNAFNKEWITKNNLTYPILNDADGVVGKAYGAKTTPEMYVIGRDGRLLYMGGIDNDPDGDKGAAKVNYVAKALDEILADKPVSTPETPSYGCSVKYGQ